MSTTHPPASADTLHVGRVGALAAALGIGIAITFLSPAASAKTEDTQTNSANQESRTNSARRTDAAASVRPAEIRSVPTPNRSVPTPNGSGGKTSDSPASWAVLAAARGQVSPRRYSTTIKNHSSIADGAAQSTPPGTANFARTAAAVPASAATVPNLIPGKPDVFAPNPKGIVYGGARITNIAAGILTFTAPATTAGGAAVTINPATGAFSYTPTRAQRQNADLNTTDTFTITATNATGLITTQAVTVVVDPGTPMPRTPWVPTPDRWSAVVRGISKFSDESGRVLTYSAPATTAGGGAVIIDPVTGAFTYTPTRTQRQAAGLNTTDTFTVTATNGVRTSTQVITVQVDPGTPFSNTPWVRTPNPTTGTVTGIAKFVDSAGRAVTYSAAPTTTGGGTVTINAATGAFTYTPTAAQRQAAWSNTTDTFTVTASNGLRTATQTITVPVTDAFQSSTSIELLMDGANNSYTWTDTSGNGSTFFGANGARITTDRGGASTEFTKSRTSYVGSPSLSTAVVPSGNDPYTMEAWVYPRSYSTSGIIGWGDYGSTNRVNALRLSSDGKIVNYWWFNDLYTAPVITLNTWTHIAASYDGTTRRIFVNGVLVASDRPTGHNVTRVDNLTVGMTGTNETFDGYLDSVRVTEGARYTTNFIPTPR